ncbi:hypothetical protein K435DRAFT_968891 [Dendrothele bispora CBS 962.96]|uniref:Mug135-like C-terminal domain-containing protein n=1 Tax=Dendrothele bispora (strain CBS 962.96) TaxID=1314807 RepID=A0A4S8LL13_DENBC|nr:hypothetical protein K435DRAFT_968891 [Dendrothele bispora CBS 962.96]
MPIAVPHDQADVVPAWFGPALETALAPIHALITGIEDRLIGVENRLTEVEDRLTEVEDRLTRVEENQRAMKRDLAISYNASAAEGHQFPFRVVSFPDGSDPVVDHGLPALVNTSVINRLSNTHTSTYYEKYILGDQYGNADATYDSKRFRIAVHIGCRVSILSSA